MKPIDRKQSKKDGAALVIAIGFLAILTLSIIAFTVQTRMERLAGHGFLLSAQTRQLLNTALSRALEDIDTEVGGTNYPEFLALGSLGNSSTAAYLADSLDFTVAAAYIPGSNSTLHADYRRVLADEAQWQTLTDPDHKIIGRVGYVILNTSGLLDANQVAGSNRSTGISPSEIQLSPELLHEFNTTSGPFPLLSRTVATGRTTSPTTAFSHNRSAAWNRFESLRDVMTLNQRNGRDLINSQPESFRTFSLFPNPPTNKTALSATIAPTVFTTSLLACKLSADEAAAVIESYQDYVDADSIPINLLGACTEAVPLINEFAIINVQFDQAARNESNVTYAISGELFVETWYPFSDTHPTDTLLELHPSPPTGEIVTDARSNGDNTHITITAAYPNGMEKSFVLALEPANDPVMASGNFNTFQYTFGFNEVVLLADPLKGVPDPQRIHLRQDRVDVFRDQPIDRVEKIEFQFDYTGGGVLNRLQASCIDPRINYDFSDPTHWILGANESANRINHIQDWGEQSELIDKSLIRLYVRNGPMQNAAELGFLSTGEPWRTVRLYGGDGETLHPVLDFFHANEIFRTAPSRAGLINRNSPHTNVLATAFFDAPIQNTPESVDARISVDQARQLGGNMEARFATSKTNSISDIGHAVSNNIPDWTTFTDAQKESIVANTYRLFGWRDSHYTLLLAAQKATDINRDGTLSEDEVQSSQQAIAYIWRDPITQKSACIFYGLSDSLRSLVGGGTSWGSILQAFKP